MGKNVYAAPRKRPAAKRVDQAGDKPFGKDQQQSRQARLQELAAQYKKRINKEKNVQEETSDGQRTNEK